MKFEFTAESETLLGIECVQSTLREKCGFQVLDKVLNYRIQPQSIRVTVKPTGLKLLVAYRPGDIDRINRELFSCRKKFLESCKVAE
jgi:hypothetical protein